MGLIEKILAATFNYTETIDDGEFEGSRNEKEVIDMPSLEALLKATIPLELQ
ncbi:hypothetical protein LCGC14_0195890 [marine sediment metagenome]|uniref:Uncharacterized protein n=1 Tax=marine sediment metagenome TaxID=412755 RepID=A0A0F9X4I0_9ZZZZ